MFNNRYISEDINEIFNQNQFNEDWKDKSIFITGGTGLIASYLILYFLSLNRKHDYNIKLYVNVRSSNRFKEKIGFNDGEIVIIEKNVEDIDLDDFKNINLDYIFHLAGSSSPYAIVNHPTSIINANVTGTINIAKLGVEKHSKVIFSSTREVYGKVDNTPLLVEGDIGVVDQTELRSCYPESKRMAENILVSFAHEFDLKYSIARIAHVYGPGMLINNDGRIMSDLISFAVNKEDIKLQGDGTPLRAFCYITDALLGLLYIAKEPNNNIYNLANEYEEISLLDLSKKIINLFPDFNLKLEVGKGQKDKIGYLKYKRVGLDTKKLEELGWKPHTNLDKGLYRTVQSFLVD